MLVTSDCSNLSCQLLTVLKMNWTVQKMLLTIKLCRTRSISYFILCMHCQYFSCFKLRLTTFIKWILIDWLKVVIHIIFTVHCLRWRMPHFIRQCWGLPYRLAQCMSPQGWGKLVNAALLTLINEACMSVRCATILLSELNPGNWTPALIDHPSWCALRFSHPNHQGRWSQHVMLKIFGC